MANILNKIVILGDSGVGKTALLEKWVNNRIPENGLPTVGAAYFKKTLVIDDVEQKFQFWDTAGEEQYRSLAPIYSRHAVGAVVVFDVTSKITMDNVPKWIECLELNGEIPVVLAANKVDLDKHRQISSEELLQFAHEKNLPVFETSAMSGIGVDELFHEIATLSMKKKQEEVPINSVIQIENEKNEQKTNSKSCCK